MAAITLDYGPKSKTRIMTQGTLVGSGQVNLSDQNISNVTLRMGKRSGNM